MVFKKYKPSHLLQSVIANYWTLESGAAENCSSFRFVPDGYVDWIFHLKMPWQHRFPSQTEEKTARFHVFGHFKKYMDIQLPEESILMFGIKFHPWASQPFWQMDMSESTDRCVALEDLADKDISHLASQILAEQNVEKWITLAENFLLKKLGNHQPNDLQPIVRSMMSGMGGFDFSKLSVSRRRIEQRFKNEIGISPRVFQRTIKINCIIQTLFNQPSLPLTSLAYRFGYADQSHMIREFNRFSGYSPKAFLKKSRPDGDIFNLRVE